MAGYILEMPGIGEICDYDIRCLFNNMQREFDL